MRAWLYDRYGGPEVLRAAELPEPVPARGEVLVRVEAAALNPKDALVRKGRFRAVSGRRFPKRVGLDLAGVVEAVGPGVRGFAPGQRVWGFLEEMRALRGSLATSVAARAREIAPLPEGLGLEEAAAVPLAAQTALQALRDLARVSPGRRVLVLGGSGGVGSFALQIARALGARVTSVSSGRNLDLCRSLGAEVALDYAQGDALSGRASYDAVFDAFGSRSVAEARRALSPGGTYVTTVPSARIFRDQALTLLTPPRARLVVVRARAEDLQTIGQLVTSGAVKPLVDRVVAFADVPDAFRHLETRRARGKIVVRVA